MPEIGGRHPVTSLQPMPKWYRGVLSASGAMGYRLERGQIRMNVPVEGVYGTAPGVNLSSWLYTAERWLRFGSRKRRRA